MTFREVSYNLIRPWSSRAARERVDLKNTPRTRWFMDGAGVACAGLMATGQGLRVKGVYVDPSARGEGLGTAITEHLIAVAELEGAAFVEAFAWNPDWYRARGFEDKGRNAHGAVLVRRYLTPAQDDSTS